MAERKISNNLIKLPTNTALENIANTPKENSEYRRI